VPKHSIWAPILLCLILCVAATTSAFSQPAPPAYTVTVSADSAQIYPDFQHIADQLVVRFDNASSTDPNGPELKTYLKKNVESGWKCADPQNYRVTFKLSKDDATRHKVNIDFVDALSVDKSSCDHFLLGQLVRIRLADAVHVGKEYTVEVLNIVDDKKNPVKISTASQKPDLKNPDGTQFKNSFDASANPRTVSVGAQSILSEPLSDGTYKGVEQLALSSNFPISKALGEGAALYVDTKDLISSNERDKKSAFIAGLGYEWGPQSWYAPIKLEHTVQGNQIATNLSTVSSLSIDTVLPWSWTAGVLENKLFQIPLSPDITLALPYTHRINQAISGQAKPLPVDDFAVNPALTLKNGVLLPNPYCDPNSAKKLVCFGLEADLGMYYLPLETTSKSSQRAEGYGDVSFLIPLSDFSHFPFITFDSQSLLSQIRIEYSDAVTPANNYARTRKWSFGIELIGGKK
jgi:hypothetical protein